jgi:ABC-type multidrug transport system ATPase subunit
MALIHYVEIENFKSFGGKIHVDLEHPAVIIGPNNSGKTSVIQAISLWNRGIKAWYEKYGENPSPEVKTRQFSGAGINRLNILEVPVAEIRFLWKDMHVRRANKGIPLSINIGIEHEGSIKDCTVVFSYQTPEVLYCKPDEKTQQDVALIKYACTIQFHLLYPMSGIMSNTSQETEETPLPDGRINLLLGQGQTAQVLRNLCYKVVEQDRQNRSGDWEKIEVLVRRMFLVSLGRPSLNENRGSLVLTYRQDGMQGELDISLAGRGLQQILLILAYMYWHKNSVLLIDEPDAHLEILRQRQIYAILNTLIQENRGQVIIATHSESILDEATNLTFLLQGKASNLTEQKDIKNALAKYGIEHYYRAKVHPRILYIEGSTDIAILKALALHTGHERARIVLEGTLNVYYTQNIEGENTLDNQLERIGGSFNDAFKNHFYALSSIVKEIRGVGIFDSDNSDKKDEITDRLAVVYWRNYEIENYFITPDSLVRYAKAQFTADSLFQARNVEMFEEAVSEILLESVFNNDKNQLAEYHHASAGLKRTLLKSIKMSHFAGNVFLRFSEKARGPLLLKKGQFYRLVPYCAKEEISPEVTQKLDIIVKTLEFSEGPFP